MSSEFFSLVSDGTSWKSLSPWCAESLIRLAAFPSQREVQTVSIGGLSDGLGSIHEALKFRVVLDRAGAIPSCDTNRNNVFCGASLKVGENRN